MTISETDISTYGLRLLKVSGHTDMPARKKILQEPAFTENDLKYEERKISFRLLGKYDSQDEMAENVSDFMALLQGSVQHEIVESNRNLDFTGVFADGFEAVVRRNTVDINLKVTIVE